MKRNFLLFTTALGMLGLCTAACAQSAGSFSGTSVDGGFISLTVTKVGSTYTVTQMNVNMIAPCKKTGNTANEGWGFTVNADISSGQTPFTSGNDYYYTTGAMHFTGPKTIKGTITSYTATFVPGATPPAQSQFCVAAKQAFTLTKEAPGKELPLQATINTGRLKPSR